MIKRYFQCLLSFFIICLIIAPISAFAEPTTSTILINEIQTGGVGAGTTGQEFVELINAGSTPVDLTDYKLQYTPSTGNSASTKSFVTFASGTMLYPGGYLLITPADYLAEISTKTTYLINSNFSGLSGNGATVSLIDSAGVLKDRVGYGSAASIMKENELAPAPPGGKSIQRVTLNNVAQDTDNNKNDFEITLSPSPTAVNIEPITETNVSSIPDTEPVIAPITDPLADADAEDALPVIPDDSPPIEQQTDNNNEATKVYYPILINELMIDPESPLTDTNDEWIELYNANDNTVDISGYTLYTGTNYTYRYTFLPGSYIAPHSYINISSGDTAIALANGGGAAKIVSPAGEIFDQVNYETAKVGQSWAKDNTGIWRWTTTPSKDSQNVITIASEDQLKTTTANLIAAKKPKTTAQAVPKTTTKVASAAKPKTTSKAKSSNASNNISPGLIDAPMPIPSWLLAVFGGLAILYAVYEYRFELSNKIYQFRAYRANRRANRAATSRWRSNSAGE